MTNTSNHPIQLPASVHPVTAPEAESSRRFTIIGANGSGKTRFMNEMTELAGNRAYCLDVLTAFFPEQAESLRPGSIDVQYREAVRQHPYLRTDAISKLDKLFYMIFADELESLLEIKQRLERNGKIAHLPPSKLDLLRKQWEHFFPGNRLVREGNRLRFGTGAGDDLITAAKLSQGEKAVLYYLASVQFAMPDAVIFIDSPSLFIHPAILNSLWDTLEEMRPDCTFVYNSVDVEFVTSRTRNTFLWVRSYDSTSQSWDYDVLKGTGLSDDLMIQLAGSRKPVLFIEGDEHHSIDMKLYSQVFRDRTVRPLGSCNKVIETVRAFNDLNAMHHLASKGIVDRDRRTASEVEYLRNKNVMVPEVAEVENIFLLPEIVTVMARRRGRNSHKIVEHMKHDVIRMFRQRLDEQALQHTRHKIKRDVECRIDARFSCITAMETHIRQLIYKLEPRAHYNRLRKEFTTLVQNNDYYGILRVFNHKPMLAACNIHGQLNYKSPADYIAGVLDVLKTNCKDAEQIRQAIRYVLKAEDSGTEENHDTGAKKKASETNITQETKNKK